MEQLKNGWDLFLLPKAWHKRLNTSLVSLVPGFVLVGFFNVFCSTNQYLKILYYMLILGLLKERFCSLLFLQ